MKRIFLSTVVLLAVAGGSARAEEREFSYVPPGSWPYAALSQLVERGEIEEIRPPFVAKSISRYEFAVMLVRWMNRQQQKGSLHDIDKRTKDIVYALGYEFASEIVSIQGRGPVWENPLKSQIDSIPASEWFETWWNNPSEERRIQIPKRVMAPSLFLRRQGYRSTKVFISKTSNSWPDFLRPGAQAPTALTQDAKSLEVLMPDGTLLPYDKIKLQYTTAVGSARAESREFEDVPIGSWPYSALAQLLKTDRRTVPSPVRPKTRYEFAVAIYRWQKENSNKQDSENDSKIEATFKALSDEFAAEIAKIPEHVEALERRTFRRS